MKNVKITVCDKCLQASCWQGVFMCQQSAHAGTTQKTIAELSSLRLEHPSWWVSDKDLAEGKGRQL